MAQQTPPGWYPDPSGSGQHRYWDGQQWTQHLHPGNASAQPQQPAPQVPQQAAPQQQAPQQMPPQGQYPPQQQAPYQGQVPGQAQQQYPPQGQQMPPQGQYPPQQQAPQQQPSQLEKVAELNVDGGHSAERVQQQVNRGAGVAGGPQGGGTLFTEPVVVVNQKAKLVEVSSEYSVYNQHGQQIAAVAQVGQSAVKKAVRFLGKYDQYMTHKLEIRDGHGQLLMQVTRPAKFLKSRVIVERGDGQPIGELAQQNVMGKKTFAMTANGQEIGQIRGEDWFSFELGIFDHTDTEVARITKTWEGLGKAMFTTADNYVLKMHRPLAEPLLSLVLASALTVDIAIHQDSK